jgi:hypothetical protein
MASVFLIDCPSHYTLAQPGERTVILLSASGAEWGMDWPQAVWTRICLTISWLRASSVSPVQTMQAG